MGFRDDNEALRARTRAAEQRAERAETDRERMERELAEARANDDADQKRIAELEKRLAELEPQTGSPAQPSGAKPVALALALVTLLAGVGAGFFLTISGQPESPDALPAATAAAEPAAAPVPAALEEPAPAPVSPLERVRLAGVVLSADGVEGLEPGDGCVVDSALSHGGGGHLAIRCGAGEAVRVVFDGSEDTGGGMTSSSGNVLEVTTGEGSVARSIAYSLTGMWSGPQAQIQLNTDQRAARVWREGLNARDVLIHLENAAGTPGEPVLRQGGTAPIARGTQAKLVAVGDVPGALGELDTDHCTVRTEPVARAGNLNARIIARCGERTLYGTGTTGWIPATADGGIVARAEDTEMSSADHDPAMTYTGETLTIVEPEWRIAFRVEPDPRCTLASGTWFGAVRDATGELQQGARLEDGELTLPGGQTLSGAEDMRCHEGVARWTDDTGEVVLDGRFGPELATFVGTLADGSLIELYRAD